MGIPDSSLLDQIEKVRTWVSWGGSDLLCFYDKFDMLNSSCEMCCDCNRNNNEMSLKYNCKSCGRLLCGKCIQGCDLSDLKSENSGVRETTNCKFCSSFNGKYSDKVHPSDSPHESPRKNTEPPSPCFSVDGGRTSSTLNSEFSQNNHFECYLQVQDYGYVSNAMINGNMALTGAQPTQVTTHSSTGRYNNLIFIRGSDVLAFNAS